MDKVWIAWKLPRRLIEWATIRLVAHATSGQYSNQIVPNLTTVEALRRW